MTWNFRRRVIQLRIVLRSNRGVFLLVLAWFAVMYGLLLNSGMDPAQAARLMCFLEQANNSQVGFFYQSMTDIVFFGLVVSVLLVDVQRQVRPEITSRILAQELHDHAVVINLSNVGRRAFELFKDHHVPVAVLDSDHSRIEDLIHDGYPCAVSSGRHATDLEDVNVAQAKLVLVSCDDLETVPVLCNWVRRANPTCTLIARCYEDEIGEVLAKRYKATIISTSKLAAEYIRDFAGRQKVQHCLLIGCGQLGRRMIPILKGMGTEFTFLVDKPDHVEDLVDNYNFLFGPSHDRDLLEASGVGRCELVILTEDSLAKALTTVDRIRQINTSCRIVCRVFHDDSADMLSSPPFRCEVISTSRYAIDHLKSQGAFQKLGIGPEASTKYRHVPLPPGEAPPRVDGHR